MTSLDHVQQLENRQKTEMGSGDVSVIQDVGRKLLRDYSGISNKEMDNHIEAIVSHYH